MTCDQFEELHELYALGALESNEAEAMRAHLAEGCKNCEASVDRALVDLAVIAATTPLVEPPPALRDRVMASVGAAKAPISISARKPSRPVAAWLAAAAAALILIAGIGVEDHLRRQTAAQDAQKLEVSVRAQAQRTAELLQIIQAPGTKDVGFHPVKPDVPKGHIFVNSQAGAVMLIADLPAPPPGWKYESWVVPKNGAPQPVESFERDSNGVAFTIVKGPVDTNQWAALAVSLEPENSQPVKPTRVVFASPV